MPISEAAQSGLIFSAPGVSPRFVEAWYGVLHLGSGLDDSRMVAEFGRLSGLASDHIPPEQTTSLEASADVRVVGQLDSIRFRVKDPSWDHIYDQFAAEVQNMFGQKLVFPRNGNLNLIQNMVEQLSGDNNLISIRSRATMNRPFTRVKEMQAKAEEGFRAKIKELEKTLADAQTKLNNLQKNKESGQRFILSPEQQAEIQKFQQKQADVKKELKQVRKNLRQEIDSLENRLKWVNIAGMPLLVTVSGISLALLKRKRTAAR